MTRTELNALLTGFQWQEAEDFAFAEGDLSEAEPILIARNEKGHTTTFEHSDLKARIDPSRFFLSYQSAIVLFSAYPLYTQNKEPGLGQLASFAIGRDYHTRLKERLEALAEYLKDQIPSLESRIAIDTTPLLDRQLAYQTGKAFYGKNHQVIHKKFGSAFQIGSLLTNVTLSEPVEKLTSQCGTCSACIDACPHGALSEGDFDPRRCISYLTQIRSEPSCTFEEPFRGYLYGCDLCQLVCPFSDVKGAPPQEALVPLEDFVEMSNKAIARALKGNAALWRGPALLKRNAKVLLDTEKRRSLSKSVCHSRTNSL